MIRAIIETSLVDWDGKLTTVLFFDKCNFLCPFCQNWELILHSERFPIIEWDTIEKKLKQKKGWIDAVVLTGGEPLVFKKDVFELTRRIKGLDLLIKLDTNGSFPEILKTLLKEKLIDYVAMDIKAPLDERYFKAAGKMIELNKLKSSIEILMQGSVEYEFRTTCVPGLINKEIIKKMGESIRGAKRWVLQQYVPDNAYKEEYRKLKVFTKKEAEQFLEDARTYVSNTELRGKFY
ncbi:anaerobic ribonucleoside-triphosphate reductase activating protein [candidate division WOR-3 bacterium 4484_100]|uniref:Anaerobic ribonucleoside-triphosphate reductase activating protein n=1 Tax=candidate division WOR-3 bacterium 4484_100 TaxID=1936077 RepID=A0A1V4QGV0_UNCW3|nr:MAG: anaerobic ribonucleoside-triphosphate reductase activating protein [candidate division WOR-3 bacterium 4484_100]